MPVQKVCGENKPFATKKDAALFYASLGWKIFPLCWPSEEDSTICACGWNHTNKVVGKAPRVKKGFREATCDLDTVNYWWTTMPLANIGLAVNPSELIVIDADSQTAIEEVEKASEQEGLEITFVPTTETARGRHYYFKKPTGEKDLIMAGVRLGVSRNLDLTEYVILPTSTHQSGITYNWRTAPTEFGDNLRDLPLWLKNVLKPEDRQSVGALDISVLPEEPSKEAALTVIRTIKGSLCNRAIALINGTIPSEDRSGQAYELARLLAEKGITDLWVIASAVFASVPHRHKFDTRKDGWLDACRIASRALEEQLQPVRLQESIQVLTLDSVVAEDPEFLVHPYIPRGEVTMLEGDPGVGKTYLLFALIAGLTGSEICPVPFDHTAIRDAKVLLLTTEDSFPKTIRTRLEKLGANLKNIYFFKLENEEGVITTAEFGAVRNHILQISPDLIVIDPITVYATGDTRLDMDKNTHVRNILKPVIKLSREINAACLIVRHFRKGSGKAIHRGAGSIDVTAAARSMLSVGRDPNTGVLAMAHAKSNLIKRGPTLTFSITESLPPFKWLGISESINADTLTDDPKISGGGNTGDTAKDFLQNLFDDSNTTSLPAKEIMEAATVNGLNKSALHRAKESLGIVATRQGSEGSRGSGQWFWRLPQTS